MEMLINKIYYDLDADSNTAVVTGWDDEEELGNIRIPATIGKGTATYRVEGIGDSAFEDCDSLISIVMVYRRLCFYGV